MGIYKAITLKNRDTYDICMLLFGLAIQDYLAIRCPAVIHKPNQNTHKRLGPGENKRQELVPGNASHRGCINIQMQDKGGLFIVIISRRRSAMFVNGKYIIPPLQHVV